MKEQNNKEEKAITAGLEEIKIHLKDSSKIKSVKVKQDSNFGIFDYSLMKLLNIAI